MAQSDPHTQARLLHGGCRCGAVRYQARDSFLYALNCHCSRCRAASGSAFRAIAALLPRDFRLTQGANAVFIDGDPDSTHDVHCVACGSLLYSWIAEPDNNRIHLPMGTLHDTPTMRPQMHICVGSKAPWYDILDDLPQFDGLPGA
jgi:hypothetical protein